MKKIVQSRFSHKKKKKKIPNIFQNPIASVKKKCLFCIFYNARRPIYSNHKTSLFFVTIIADSYCPEPHMSI